MPHILSLPRSAGTRQLPLPDLGRRHFLTVGRQGVSSFAEVTGAWFLVRSIDPPQEPTPPQMELLLERGPYLLDAEIALMQDRRVDTVVTKNSGGAGHGREAGWGPRARSARGDGAASRDS
jgi:precorrin-6A/cobalt-precorrin-6A reductase